MTSYKIKQSRKGDVTPAVFIVASTLQNLGAPVYGLEIVRAIQEITGEIGDVICVQKTQGVWRINPKTKSDRAKILLRGITVRGHAITVLGTSPRLVNGLQTIRVNIANIPYEIPDSEVQVALDLLELKFGSSILYEFYKDEEKQPTSVKTGRRYVNIVPPSKPLPEYIKVSDKYRAYLQYNRKEVHGSEETGNSAPRQNQNNSAVDHSDSSQAPWSWPPNSWKRPAGSVSDHIQKTDAVKQSEEDNLRWPPTPSGWWKGPSHEIHDLLSNDSLELDCITLPSAPPLFDWQPGPRKGFPPKPVVTNSMDDARSSIQANLNTLLGDNDIDASHDELHPFLPNWAGEGYWSAKAKPLVSLSPITKHDKLSVVDTDKKLNSEIGEEEDFLSQESLITLQEDIGITYIPSCDTSVKGSAIIENILALEPECCSEKKSDASLGTNESYESYVVTGPGSDSNPAHKAVKGDTSPVHNEVSGGSSAQKLVEIDNIHVVDTHTLSMNIALDLPSSTENFVETNIVSQPSLPTEVSSTHATGTHTLSMNIALDLPSSTENFVETNIVSQPSLPTEVSSTHATGTQQQVGQTTLLNFLSPKSRSRSLAKEDNTLTRRRSSSKRKGASPTDTPKSKKLSKSKRQGVVSGKTGSSSGNKETVSENESVTEVRKVTVESAQPSQTMDWWLNQPSPS